MRHRFLVSLVIALVSVRGTDAQTTPGSIQWNNGDKLPGQLIGFQDDHFQWESDQFSDPLELHSDFIAAVDFPRQKATPAPVGGFRVETVSGDALFGDLVSIDESHIVLASDRLGTVRVRRGSVREIRQLKHTEVLYDGPRWLDDWTVLKAGRRVAEWEATEHGHLRTEKYGGELFHTLPELDVAEINLVLTWSGKPGFQVDFSAPSELVATRPRPRLSLKSWGTDVVAQSSLATADFQHLLKLGDRDTELRLRLVWDNKSGEIVIYGEGSRVLGRVVVSKPQQGTGFGVLVKNRSDDLTLEQIRLSKWNGASGSEDREPGQGYVRLASGELANETIESMANGSDEVRLQGGKTLPIADIAVAEFVPTARRDFQPQHIRFSDGSEFSGKIESLDDEAMRVVVPAIEGTVSVKRDGLESIRCFQGRTNEYEFHLTTSIGRLSGNLKPVPESDAVGWAPVGSKHAVRLEVGAEQTIERRSSREDGPVLQRGNEVVYLKDNSVLIGDLVAIDGSELTVSTPYSGEKQVPVSEVSAAEMMQGTGRVNLDRPEWEFLRSARPLQRSQDRLEVSDPISMRDLSLYHGGKLTFTCAWDEDFVGLLTLHLGTSTKQPRSSVARFTFSQDRLSARCLVNAAASRKLPPIGERRATISLESTDDRLTAWVNGVEAFSTELKDRIEHRGLWIQCGSARGPMFGGAGNRKPRLVIERLRVGDGAGRLGAGFAAAGDVDMLLKLPRNRVKDAPSCVLCSTNGDLLRGDLVRLDGEVCLFKSRYEQVSLPREGVAALVWLGPADEVTPERPQDGSLLITLRDGSVFYLKQPRVVDDQIVGQHNLLGECSFPLSHVLKLQNGAVDFQSVASIVNWKLERTPEPSFVEGDLEPGLGSPLIGQTFDDVVIPMLKGGEVRLGDLRGSVVVLDFWASWCAPCIKSLPRMIAVTESFESDQLRFIAVNEEEQRFTIESFVASRDLQMDVGFDADLSIGQRFNVEALPQTVILDVEGKVARVFIGVPSDLHKSIQAAIAELLPPED